MGKDLYNSITKGW